MAQAGIDEPMAREPQAGPESTPEREQLTADLTEIRERAAAIEEAVKQTPDPEAERVAEIDAAGENEPVAHGPQAEPELEPSWQRGEASADSEAWAPGRNLPRRSRMPSPNSRSDRAAAKPRSTA